MVKKRRKKTQLQKARQKKKFEMELKRLNKKYKPLHDAIAASQLLTAEDFAITINC